MKVKHIKAEQASVFYHGIAYAEFHLDRFDDARKAAEAAKKYARNLEESAAAEDMLRVLDQEKDRRAVMARPTAPPTATVPPHPAEEPADEKPKQLVRRTEGPPRLSVLGTLRQVDCLGEIVRLRVTAGEKQVVLAIRDPENVRVKGSPTGKVDLACGPQKRQLVIVEYEKRDDAELGTVGDVRSMEFQ
jgi:hypothetical protein